MLSYVGGWSGIATLIVAMVGSGGLSVLVTKWLDYKRGRRKDSDEVAMGLVTIQNTRIERLEAAAARMAADANAERYLCDAKLRIQGHAFGNLDACFNAMLMMHKIAPEKAAQTVEEVMKLRAEQKEREEIEKSSITAIANRLAAGETLASDGTF